MNQMNLTNEFQPIRNWARAKGIYELGDPKTQTLKLVEEVGELSNAVLKENQLEIEDALGDCVVVLVSIARLRGVTLEKCINSAFQVIENRTGRMENGTFVKNSK